MIFHKNLMIVDLSVLSPSACTTDVKHLNDPSHLDLQCLPSSLIV